MSGEASILALCGDDWDPNILFNQPPHECRIYGDDNAQTWSVISPRWYPYVVCHRWRWKGSRDRGKETKKYLCRNVQVIHYKGSRETWQANRTQYNLFLHEFIMELRGLPKPSPKHIVDHRDGDETNCLDENLRWATKSLNARNKYGSHAGEEHDE